MKRAKKSLTSVLTIWFLTFTIIPLAFIYGYSTVLYKDSINSELQKRLEGNIREIGVSLAEFETFILTYGKIHASDPTLSYHASTRNVPAARRILTEWLKTYTASRIVLFDREGRLLVAQERGPTNQIKPQANLETGDVFLSDEMIRDIGRKGQFSVRETQPQQGLLLIVFTKILDKRSKNAGYLEEVIKLDQAFILSLKKRLNLEAVFFDGNMKPVISSNEDLLLLPPDFFPSKIGPDGYAFFDITSRGEPFGMMVKKIVDPKGKLYVTLGLAASKTDTQKVLRRIKLTLLFVTILVLLFLIPLLIYVSKRVVKPIHQLVEATQKMEAGEPQKLENVTETEMGLLVESFNEMSRKISLGRQELEKKLEELKNTQATLIHSAKMASLGQLVAGVAHELNNPIGFIYSNIAHLREYADKLQKVWKTAETNPEKLDEVKKEVDFDYIVEDLPKLLTSCEDGARRTRDIVLGLRNFSRLDEAQLKKVDIKEGLQNTLKLLASELKNRIKLHEDYGKMGNVRCYASQLNQVFMNIISNAAQAIPGDGDIWIKTWEKTGMANISIRDSGPGIPQTAMDKIFDPFFTTKPVGKGTGLGLSISYGIVQKHGGEITVQNVKEGGTEFVIKVPMDGPSDAGVSNTAIS